MQCAFTCAPTCVCSMCGVWHEREALRAACVHECSMCIHVRLMCGATTCRHTGGSSLPESPRACYAPRWSMPERNWATGVEWLTWRARPIEMAMQKPYTKGKGPSTDCVNEPALFRRPTKRVDAGPS